MRLSRANPRPRSNGSCYLLLNQIFVIFNRHRLLRVVISVEMIAYSRPYGSFGPLLFQLLVERPAAACLGGLNRSTLFLEALVGCFSKCDFFHERFLPITLGYPRAEMFCRALHDGADFGVFRKQWLAAVFLVMPPRVPCRSDAQQLEVTFELRSEDCSGQMEPVRASGGLRLLYAIGLECAIQSFDN